MFDIEPVEGVHYIFDRYSFINTIMDDGGHEHRLDPGSPEKTITTAIKLARAMYHPDRQTRSGEKMRKEAERMSFLIDDCATFLTNADLKPLYDAKLAQFQTEKPQLVSKSGRPIIDLSGPVFNLDSLLSDKVLDTSAFEAQVKSMLGYDDSRALQMKALYESMPDNAQIKSLYRDALTQQLVYLTLLEDAAWAKIGYANRQHKTNGHLTSSEDYAGKVEEALQKAAQADIQQAVEQRGDAARIGLSTLPLLLTFNQTAKTDTPPSTALMDPAQMQAILAKLKVKAHENFEIRADYVRDVARQKQATLCLLVTLTPVTPLNAHNPTDPAYDFYLANAGDEEQVLLRMELDVKTGSATIGEVYQGTLSVAALKSQGLTRNAFLVERNKEISDLLVEVSAAADRVFTEKKDAFSSPPTKPGTPQP